MDPQLTVIPATDLGHGPDTCGLCGHIVDGRTEAISDQAIVTADGREVCDGCAARYLPTEQQWRLDRVGWELNRVWREGEAQGGH